MTRTDLRGSARRALALALLAWLVWRAGVGTVALGEELGHGPAAWRDALTLTAEQRIRRTLAQTDLRLELTPGYLSGIVRAIEQHVPRGTRIQLLGVDSKKRIQALVPVPHLCFPTDVAADLVPLPDGWEPDATSTLLVFDPRLDERLRQKKQVLASGPDWKLWR